MLIGGTVRPGQTDRDREGLLGPVQQLASTSGATTTMKTFDRTGALTEAFRRVRPPAEEPEAEEQVQTLVYLHDSTGKRLREMIVDPDGQQYLSRLYAHDSAGNTEAEAVYHLCGTFSALHVSSYDASGLLREELSYQFRSITKQVYDYDDRRTLTARRTYRNSVLQFTTRYTHDGHGRLIGEAQLLPDGTIRSNATYQYDVHGNRISEEEVHADDPALKTTSLSTYEYDKRGNWIRRTVRQLTSAIAQGGNPLSEHQESTERTITYYSDAF
jgi:hypothetical protein